MTDRECIRETLRALARRLRLVRALSAAIRFLVLGLALAVAPLLLKGLFPIVGPLAAVGLTAGLTGLGFLYGLLAPLSPGRVARLADKKLGLQERLTSAEEFLALAEAPDVVRAQLAETAARARAVRPGAAFPFRLPAEARFALPAAALALALALLPAVPLHLPIRSDETATPEARTAEEQREKPLEQKLATPALPKDLFPKAPEQPVQAGPLTPRDHQGDLTAVFRDTKLSQQRPDFGSFVKQGDDRLKLLAQPESIPDLRQDYTQSPYQMMIRRMQQQLRAGRLQGLSWEQIERLLSELGQSGQRAGSGGLEDLMQELQGEGAGAPDKMLSALSRALSRLRDRDEAARGKGSRLQPAPDRQRGAGQGRGEGQEDGRDEGGAGGSAPGTEKSLQTRGAPGDRIGGEKQDSLLEGDPRDGQKEAYDTNLSGPGAQNASRLLYLDVFSQYKQQMEEALTREPIPFNYRQQVKEYFQALEAR